MLASASALTAHAQLPAPLAYYDFEGDAGTTLTDKSGNNYNGDIVDSVTFGDGAPEGSTPGTGGQFSLDGRGYVDVTGFDWFELVHEAGDGDYTLSCWLKPDEAALSGDKFIWGQTSQGVHNGVRGSGTLHTAHWGADSNASTPLEADEWVHAIWTYNGADDLANIYLNGENDLQDFSQRAPNGSGSLILGGRNGGGENFNGSLDDMAIWAEVLDADAIALLAGGASPINVGAVDSDADGMLDSYEEKNELEIGANDSALDKDGDGLTNKEEHDGTEDAGGNKIRPQTFANDPDSDDDGLSDKVESNTGVFVSTAGDTGTHPRRDDTDRDDLKDGVETKTGIFVSATNTGTDPFKDDSDGDGRKDGREVESGTNPLDAGDPPPPDPSSVVSGYWPLDADLKDASGSGGDGELMGGDDDIPDFVEGKLGTALSLDGIGEYVEINPDLEDLYSGHNEDGEPNPDGFSVSAWFKVGVWDKTWQCLVAKGEGNRWRVHRRGGETVITGNGGNGDVPNNRTVEPEDDEWHFLVLTSNPELDEAKLWVDGQLEGENTGLNLEDNSMPMMIGENPDARNRTWNGLVDDVAFFKKSLTEEEVLMLWNDGEGASVAQVFLGGGTPLGFRITNVEYLTSVGGAAAQVRVTWASRSGATYAVDQSQTIPENADGWEEVADGVDSGGEATSFTIPVPVGANQLYVRVRQE
ncbi:MAG: hypothetical protein O3C21_01560 [Verrucomicrobia bacterium]|nr:hypothetical protein [Verrucomicrobiota bacterium]